ncbi:MAG: DUF3857 domain-containing protein [Kiritimatiellae bacterium]|jgi:transglutaminase-like putative cysteine protease|nr:DUF3857 domain-containing protein [Kiritimatiellia bacterium]
MQFFKILVTSLLFSCIADADTTQQPPADFLLDTQAVTAAAIKMTAQKFPNADTILVDDHVLEEYNKDGTSICWDDEYTKVLTEKGRRSNTSHDFSFDTSYSTSFVYRAEIIKPDGKILPIDIEQYSKIMTEQSQMGSNIYDPSNKILTLATPGVEVGDICHIVSCRINTKARMSNTWADYSVFEYNAPIAKLDYEIIAPPGLPIKHKLIRSPIKDSVTYTETKISGDRTRHLWLVKDIPQMFPEPDMPPLHTQVQRLLLSTIKDWKTVSRWYWELCIEPMSKTTPEMRAKVKELTDGLTGREEKIRSIFKFVSQDIRYMGITTEDVAPGYEPHPVDMTFNNRYGVCRDKAALLAAMLRMADIPAYPVLIHAGAKMDHDIPVPFFNHAITAVDKPGGGYSLMDPTDENTKDIFPAYLCNRSYLVAKEEGETLLVSEIYPAEKNMMLITSEGVLDATGSLLLKSRLEFKGINDNAYRSHFLRNKQDKRRKFFESALKKRLAGAELIECTITPEDLQDTEQPLLVTLTSRIPDYPVKGDSLDLVTMPWLSSSIGYVNFVIGATGLKERKYTMKTDITCGVKETITINVAAGLKSPYSIPPKFTVDKAGVLFSIEHAYKDGRLSAELIQKIKTPEFSPAEYLVLKQNLKEIEAQTRKRPLFTSGNANPPDHEMLFNHTKTEMHSPTSWTTTTSWSKRILTYAGKKKNSELKYSYNPIWQNIELVSATVSNANGKVFTVTDKEINLMDAGWTASAPRYPAGKTLIINLPGVETGSVITVQTMATRSNANFYANSIGFGGTSPSANESFELTWPRNLTPVIQSFNLHDYVTCSAVTNDQIITTRWSSENPPELEAESGMPPWHFHNPQAFISFGEWNKYTRDLKKVIRKALKEDDATEKHVKELLRGIKKPQAKILAVRNDVLRNIRIAGPSYLALPLSEVSTADQTLGDQYGNALDRAILMAAMLDEAGFNPEIIFASSNSSRYSKAFQPNLDVPQAGFFSNPLIKLRSKGQTYYLSDGDQYTELGVSHFHDAPALNLKGDINYIQIPEDRQNQGRSSLLIDLSADGSAMITSTNWYYGTSYSSFRKTYSEMLPEDRRRHYLETVNSVAKSATAVTDLITNYDTFPGYKTYTVKAQDYAVIENNTLTLNIPMVSGTIFPVRTDTRTNPLFMKSNSQSKLVCTVILPPGYNKLALLPQSKVWQLPAGVGTFSFDVLTKERSDKRTEVTITRSIQRSSGELAPELYPAILEYNRISSHPSMRTLVAEKE